MSPEWVTALTHTNRFPNYKMPLIGMVLVEGINLAMGKHLECFPASYHTYSGVCFFYSILLQDKELVNLFLLISTH